jgi:4-hydroxy-3-polyprenylbenzoate decarboxylase
MAYSGLSDFITALEKKDEIHRINAFADPVLEITEITDRVTKSGGKALLFENTGTDFPVLINAYGSDKRMSMAIGSENIDDLGVEIEEIFNLALDNRETIFKKLSVLPTIIGIAGFLPSRKLGRGKCQQVIHREPDLNILPVLKCWPYDGGRFITLPLVHTKHPESEKTNVGMYRMQILDMNTTAMHWQRHKTGANHFEAWKKINKRMPVSVVLGGDPVYTYSATAPLPENISEYILAGYLRKKSVKMVRCITNDLYVPADADIVLEGYVDPSEELVWEGPFGDHTGFYSLADWYPKFHITCITHSKNAIYPATIVGIPPQEDSWLAKVTERIFLAPVKLALLPEVVDFHMPDAGIAHNMVIVKINKRYPGQGMKVISSLFGAGQMMFTKYLIVVSGDINIRNYKELLIHAFMNINFVKDLTFSHGPLDVLDHSSDTFSFGGKVGVDATIKQEGEKFGGNSINQKFNLSDVSFPDTLFQGEIIKSYNVDLIKDDIPILIITVNCSEDADNIERVKMLFKTDEQLKAFKLILVLDHTIDPNNLYMVAWQIFGNTDPQRDHDYISNDTIFIDGTIKAYRKGGFPRKWPNVVCSDIETITTIDKKWEFLGIGSFIHSPSLAYMKLLHKGRDEIVVK